VEKEEQLKKVLGSSALAKCLMLVEIVDQSAKETGKSDAKAVAQECLAIGLTAWSEDTIQRYTAVGRKLQSASVTAWLRKSEFVHGENSAFYSITALRALASPSPRTEIRVHLKF
jgi:hypothetical protein